MHLPLFKTFSNVYDPSEDSFLMMDALDLIKQSGIKPFIILEICCGIGIISSYAKHLFPTSFVISSDYYIDPCLNTIDTLQRNNQTCNSIQMNIIDNIRPCTIDLLICNPPYVPSERIMNGFDAAWAGGYNGNEAVTIPLLKDINRILQHQQNVLLLLLKVNLKDNLKDICTQNRLLMDCILSKQCGNEYLYIYKVYKH